jgi:hypothetical protein
LEILKELIPDSAILTGKVVPRPQRAKLIKDFPRGQPELPARYAAC